MTATELVEKDAVAKLDMKRQLEEASDRIRDDFLEKFVPVFCALFEKFKKKEDDGKV